MTEVPLQDLSFTLLLGLPWMMGLCGVVTLLGWVLLRRYEHFTRINKPYNNSFTITSRMERLDHVDYSNSHEKHKHYVLSNKITKIIFKVISLNFLPKSFYFFFIE